MIMVKTAKYVTLMRIGNVEIRKYDKVVLAQVEGEEGGFDILFQYISGHNRKNERVSMTSPVISQSIEMTTPVLSSSDKIAFVMPEGYTVGTTPVPFDSRIKIIEVPERYVAAIQFSGRWSASSFKKREGELLDELARNGIKTIGSPFQMLYNSPFTPWFLRRNEVAVEVDPATLKGQRL